MPFETANIETILSLINKHVAPKRTINTIDAEPTNVLHMLVTFIASVITGVSSSLLWVFTFKE